ncbi:MAG: hypothetical protein JXM69_16390 [Anaerolineae bacterium]|nr:hypothetical protein [Anaerolineae bacterium]
MGTYDHKQILADYTNGRITVEMAVGHTLQHLDKLYELQTTANINRYELRGKIDALENRVGILQAKIDRLTASIQQCLPKPKKNFRGKQ